MTELNLLYGGDENISSESMEKNDNAYSSQISGNNMHKMASKSDILYDDKEMQSNKQTQQTQQEKQNQQNQQQMEQQYQQQQFQIQQNQYQQQQNQYMQIQKQHINKVQPIENTVVNKKYEYSFLDRMNMKKSDVMKLALFSLVIVLGISIDRVITNYISKYIGDNFLTDFQELLLRFSYPVSIFLLLWIFKAL
jgi:hypothetical protein